MVAFTEERSTYHCKHYIRKGYHCPYCEIELLGKKVEELENRIGQLENYDETKVNRS